jgi:hypothetical protein
VPEDPSKRAVSAGPRLDEPSRDDLLRYTRQGWPKCCGSVMALFTEAEKPGPDDTALNRPALPPS